MTETSHPPAGGGNEDRTPPHKILSLPVSLQTGALASVERAVELAVSLDHLSREKPDLLTELRLACVRFSDVTAVPGDLATLHLMGLTTENGTPMAEAKPIVLAMVRGPEGAEVVENPFLDRESRALFDYLRNGALVSMLFDPHEVKAVHENDTVIDLMAADPDASWVGYVQGRGKGSAPQEGLPPALPQLGSVPGWHG